MDELTTAAEPTAVAMQHVPASVDWLAIAPLMIVFGTGVLVMLLEMLRPKRTNNAIVLVSLAGLAVAAYYVIQNWYRPAFETFGPAKFLDGTIIQNAPGLFLNDRLGLVVQMALVAVAFITILYSEGYLRERRLPFGEYYPLVLWATTGAMIMATSRDLLIIFLGLEVLSISLYVLVGLSSSDRKSQESALKYFLLGAFSTGFLLFGIALVYGATGSTHVSAIGQYLVLPELQHIWIDAGEDREMLSGIFQFSLGGLYVGIGLILVGFAFKVALVPFHMWAPDVYQGAPTSVTGYMAAGVKLAAFAALIRFVDGIIDLSMIWLPVLTVLAALTMTVGNVIAVVQRDAKRILAYSSIAQAGYVLVAISAYAALRGTPQEVGYSTAAYYLIAYGLMTLGAFAVLSLATKAGSESTDLDDLRGMWKRAPFLGWTMVIFMVSLAGLPPTAGFFGKFMIFMDAYSGGLLWLAILLGVNSIISAYYYVRIVKAMMADEPGVRPAEFAKPNLGLLTACAVCAVLLVVLAIGLQPFLDWLGLGAQPPFHVMR